MMMMMMMNTGSPEENITFSAVDPSLFPLKVIFTSSSSGRHCLESFRSDFRPSGIKVDAI